MDASAGVDLQRDIESGGTVTILGSTGSIGQQTLDVIRQNNDRYSVLALTAQSNVYLLARQAIDHGAKLAVIGDATKFEDLKSRMAGTGIEVAAGEQAIIDAVGLTADCYMAAIVGVAGLKPTYEAAKKGTRVALANKECLVSAGPVFMKGISDANAELIPVDSEHSAAFQALQGAQEAGIRRVILTASGGPFRTWSLEDMQRAKAEDALRHPTWSMGRKISIDSATMMNKGLELIEAFHLFPVRPDQLGVIVHPQSIVHCLVEFADGSTLAQMSAPDMRTPIAYSLSWPSRINAPTRPLTVQDLASMTFEEPDEVRFPALRIARDVLNEGGNAGAVFNAANEVAVEAFLSGAIGFMSIAEIVESTLSEASKEIGSSRLDTIEDVLFADKVGRAIARRQIEALH